MLIPADTVSRMKPGSVIVDLAASAKYERGNCELTKPNETTTTDNGVIIVGHTNLPALAPVHSSQMFSANMMAFLKELIVDGELKLDLEDEVQDGAAITHGGKIVDERLKGGE